MTDQQDPSEKPSEAVHLKLWNVIRQIIILPNWAIIIIICMFSIYSIALVDLTNTIDNRLDACTELRFAEIDHKLSMIALSQTKISSEITLSRIENSGVKENIDKAQSLYNEISDDDLSAASIVVSLNEQNIKRDEVCDDVGNFKGQVIRFSAILSLLMSFLAYILGRRTPS